MAAITVVELRRFMADRANIFFAFIFPLLLVLVLGIQNSGDGPAGRVALVGADSSLSTALLDSYEAADLDVTRTDAGTMRTRVAQGSQQVGVIVDEQAAAAFEQGEQVDLEIVVGGQSNAAALAQVVRTATSTAMLHGAQERALAATGASPADVDRALQQAAADVPPATIAVQDTSEIAQEFAGVSSMALVSASMVLLFTFLNTLSGGAATLIQTRRDGIVRRTLAAPVTVAQTLLGIALGRLTIGVFQGLYIIVATRLLFGVDWGDLLAVAVVLVVFAMVAAGLAMVLGSVFDNEGAASGLSVGIGLVLAALGGAMVPLELFPDSLRRLAHVTPHAWGYDAMAQIQRHGGGVLDILPELGALAGMALLTLVLGGWLLRRSVSRAM